LESALNPVAELLAGAASAGHTVLPVDLVLASCSAADIAAALDTGLVIETEWRAQPALALLEIAEAEELLADGLLALAAENRLAVIVGSDPDRRRLTLDSALAGASAVVLDNAQRVSLDAVLDAVDELPETAVLALSLDPALPLAPGPGAVALDLAASGVCPVLKAEAAQGSSALDVAREAVATGRWTGGRDGDRSLILVPVTSASEALHRLTQLLTTSIPRAFGVEPADVVAVVLDLEGELGAKKVAAARVAAGVAGPVALTTEIQAPARAAVLLLPVAPTQALTRATMYAGLLAGLEHVSIVHALGPNPASLADIVAGPSDRPRRTRLVELLTTAD